MVLTCHLLSVIKYLQYLALQKILVVYLFFSVLYYTYTITNIFSMTYNNISIYGLVTSEVY